jgi:hypothetical protein
VSLWCKTTSAPPERGWSWPGTSFLADQVPDVTIQLRTSAVSADGRHADDDEHGQGD